MKINDYLNNIKNKKYGIWNMENMNISLILILIIS